MVQDQHCIKPIEPILAIKAEIEYNKQKNDYMFQRYFTQEIKKRQKPITVYGHIEVNV